jgi:hypothetical protein
MTQSRPAPARVIDPGPTGPPPPGRRLLPFLFVVGSLLLIVPLGVKGMTPAIIAGSFLLMLLLLFTLGLEMLGTVIIVVGMFFGPMTAMVLPGASFVTVADFCMVGGFMLLFPSIIRKPLWVPWQFGIGSLVFFTVGMVASFKVPSPFSSIDLNMRVVAATVLLPLAFVWWAPRGKKLFAIAIAYPIGTTFNTLYAILQGPTLGNGRYKGLTEQPTAFGYACLLGICILPFVAASMPRQYRWMCLGMAAVSGYGIWISGSRASLLVLIILAAMYPFLERSLKAAGFLAFCGILVISQLGRILDQNNGSNALSRLLGGGGAGGSDDARLKGLKEAFGVFQQSPIIGNGYEFDTFLAHNIYMQVATCVGVIGFLAFLLILWAFAIPLFTAKSPYRLLAYPAVAYIVVGPITPNLGSRYVGLTLALSLIAATIGRMGPDDVIEEPEQPPPAPSHLRGVPRAA